MNNMTLQKSILLGLFLGLGACTPTEFSSLQDAPPPDEIQSYEAKEKNIEVTGNNKTDILIITDNSGSMGDEQANMAHRMSHFLEQISELDWRIAVTTTDSVDPTLGDGNLLPMRGLANSFFYSSQQDPSLAQKIIGDTIQRAEMGDSTEQGIFATYRMLEKAQTGIKPNKDFLREDANFVALVISDEDDSGRTFKSNPAALMTYFKSQWPSKKFVFHSIITRPGDKKCQSTPGHVAGDRYAALSLLTGIGGPGGAIIGSVCADDYGSQLKGIGKSISEMQLQTIDLDCEPVGDASQSVLVYRDQSNYAEKYKIVGKKITFEHSLPIGKYHFKYECKKSK